MIFLPLILTSPRQLRLSPASKPGRARGHDPRLRLFCVGQRLIPTPQLAIGSACRPIPYLQTADRFVPYIDRKGENAEATGSGARAVRPGHVFDPLEAASERSAAYNPLDVLDPDGFDITKDANTLAHALFYDEPGTRRSTLERRESHRQAQDLPSIDAKGSITQFSGAATSESD